MAASESDRVRVSQDVAAGIAHELRNPVFAIASAAQLLRYRITDDPVVETHIGRILRESERLNAFISSLLEYGRPAPVRLSPADPDDVWDALLTTERGTLESKSLKARHVPAAPRASCLIDVEQLAHALTIALDNAIDAAPTGTDLRIESSLRDDGSWESHLTNEGPPIPADTLEHVFEPLVTTKQGHTGIGLAIARRIIADHGGSVSIASTPTTGTTLTISLPTRALP